VAKDIEFGRSVRLCAAGTGISARHDWAQFEERFLRCWLRADCRPDAAEKSCSYFNRPATHRRSTWGADCDAGGRAAEAEQFSQAIEEKPRSIAALEHQIVLLLQRIRGSRQERVDPSQLTLFSREELQAIAAELTSGPSEDDSPHNGK
jgi:hypothetical protein